MWRCRSKATEERVKTGSVDYKRFNYKRNKQTALHHALPFASSFFISKTQNPDGPRAQPLISGLSNERAARGRHRWRWGVIYTVLKSVTASSVINIPDFCHVLIILVLESCDPSLILIITDMITRLLCFCILHSVFNWFDFTYMIMLIAIICAMYMYTDIKYSAVLSQHFVPERSVITVHALEPD